MTNSQKIFNSRTFTLPQLFESNYFRIPDYQRGYSWETEHLEDLVKDIDNISELDNTHYTGTIVATKSGKENNVFEIVDGQQRLTSLVILLSQIYFKSPSEFEDIKDLYILRGSIGEEKIVFRTNIETSECFEVAIIANKKYNASIKSHEALLNARSFFQKWLLNKDLKAVYDTIANKLTFLFFTPEFTKEIGIMFEVINNRGKHLSELEKIKNFFIYYSTIHGKDKLKEDVNSKWGHIQRNLSQANRTSNDDENSFLRYCYLVFFNPNKEKSWDVYNECKLIFDAKNKESDYVEKSVSRMRAFVEFISNSSLHYAWFFNQRYFHTTYSGESKDELDKCLTYLRCQPVNASIMPLYLGIMARIDEINRSIELLKLLEIVNMRLYVLPDIFRRADSKQADLFSFAFTFYNEQQWSSENSEANTRFNNIPIKGDIFDWLLHNLTQITYAFCSAERFIDNINLDDSEEYNFYRWPGIRFFLACYEEELRSKKAKRSFDIQRILSGKKNVGENFNDQLSLEHIWASKNRVNDFPEDFHTKRRLGNFVLCGLSSNITLSNNDIPQKVNELIFANSAGEGALDMFQIAQLPNIVNDVINNDMGDYKRQTKNYFKDMAVRICDNREEKFIKFALKRWRLPNEKLLVK